MLTTCLNVKQMSFLKIVIFFCKYRILGQAIGFTLARLLCRHNREYVKKDSTILRESGEGSDADESSRPDHLRVHVQRH